VTAWPGHAQPNAPHQAARPPTRIRLASHRLTNTRICRRERIFGWLPTGCGLGLADGLRTLPGETEVVWSVPLVYRDVAAAAAVEWPPVPVAVALPQLKAGLLGHQVQFAGPGVAEGHRPQVRSLPIEGDDLGGDLGGDALLGPRRGATVR
jgi:hypothetical protein